MSEYFICSKCFERVESTKKDSFNNGCEHNWILDKGLFEEKDDKPPVMNTQINLDEEVVVEVNPSIVKNNNTSTTIRQIVDGEKVIESELDELYSKIRKEVGEESDITELGEVLSDITKYNKKTKEFFDIFNSQVVQKTSSVMASKYAIAIEKITTNLLNGLVEKSSYLEDDESGDNNLKFLLLAGDALTKYQNIMNKLKEDYIIPETDLQLEKLKEESNQEVKRPQLSREEINLLLDKLKKEKENLKENE